MTGQKARILSVVFGAGFYLVLFYMVMSNDPIPSVSKEFFLYPLVSIPLLILISEIGTSSSHERVPAFGGWGIILFTIVLGIAALADVLKGSYDEIGWIIYGIACSVGLNGWELIKSRNNKPS